MRIKEWLGFVFRPNKSKQRVKNDIKLLYEEIVLGLRHENTSLKKETLSAVQKTAEAYGFVCAIHKRLATKKYLTDDDEIVFYKASDGMRNVQTQICDSQIFYSPDAKMDIVSNERNHDMREFCCTMRISAHELNQSSGKDIARAFMRLVGRTLSTAVESLLEEQANNKRQKYTKRFVDLSLDIERNSDGN